MTGLKLIQKYAVATPEERVDLIIKYYANFMGIVEGYTDGLCYIIEAEKDCKRQKEKMELGVKIKSGGMISDPTAQVAVQKIVTREAVITCDFAECSLAGVDNPSDFVKKAYLLKAMRQDFKLLTCQLAILGTEKEIFEAYIYGEKSLNDISDAFHITYESAQQKMHKMRVRVKAQTVEFMYKKNGGVDDGKS